MPLDKPAFLWIDNTLAAYRKLLSKTIAGAMLLLMLAGPALGQESRPPVNVKGTTDIEVLGGGAFGWPFGAIQTGPGGTSEAWLAGARLGRILTDPHGPGFLRGSLQYSFGVFPVFVFTAPRSVYGGGFDAFVLRWNFSGGRRLAPYAEISGGAEVTTQDVPEPNTSFFNFTAKYIMGVQKPVGQRSAVDLSVGFWHLSNANLGNHNPSLNGVQLLVGYHWYKPGKRKR